MDVVASGSPKEGQIGEPSTQVAQCSEEEQDTGSFSDTLPVDMGLSSSASPIVPLSATAVLDLLLAQQAIIAGRWELRRYLDRGGNGVILEGYDRKLRHKVAVKFVSCQSGADELARSSILAEARAMAALNDHRFVHVLDTGELADDGLVFLVMELLCGTNLRTRLRKGLRFGEFLDLMHELLLGMSFAHSKGFIHRDLKPENLFVTDLGKLKILDLGISAWTAFPPNSTLRGANLPRVTHEVAGTQPYMAPEIWNGGPVGPQLDVWAIGVMLYEALCGLHPFADPKTPEMVEVGRIADPTVALGEFPLGLPHELTALISKALSKSPENRYPSAQSMLQAAESIFAEVAADERLTSCKLPMRLPLRLPLTQQRSAKSFRRHAALPANRIGGLALLALILAETRPEGMGPVPQPPEQHDGMVLLEGGACQIGWSQEESQREWASCKQVDVTCSEDFYQREWPLHTVELSPYYLDMNEVTNNRFALFLNRENRKDPTRPDALHVVPTTTRLGYASYAVYSGDNLYSELDPPVSGITYDADNDRFVVRPGFEQRPVVMVTWDAAQRYCAEQGKALPSEAQWECAARGAMRRRFPWGEGLPQCEQVAFGRLHGPCERSDADQHPVDVGSSALDRTPQGINDLAGNVSEWVSDRFQVPYPSCRQHCQDPVVTSALVTNDVRSLRGGSWAELIPWAVGSIRGKWARRTTAINVGFRCAAPKYGNATTQSNDEERE